MSESESSGQLRIPVRFVDGVWQLPNGGLVPVKGSAEAELLIKRSLISDAEFVQSFERRARYKVLEEGTSLLIRMTVKPDHPPPVRLKPFLKSYHDVQTKLARHLFDQFNPGTLFFVEVKLAGPGDKHVRQFGSEKGGLWLLAQGREFTLATTTILLPEIIRAKPVWSLNHAYSILSEVFEPWRISHTGNIYKHVFYQERNRTWYPLDILRNEALDRQEQQIANELWNSFMTKMTSRSKA